MQDESCVDGISIVKIPSEIIFYLFIYLSSCASHLYTQAHLTYYLAQSVEHK